VQQQIGSYMTGAQARRVMDLLAEAAAEILMDGRGHKVGWTSKSYQGRQEDGLMVRPTLTRAAQKACTGFLVACKKLQKLAKISLLCREWRTIWQMQ
jgi:hypothetical protein